MNTESIITTFLAGAAWLQEPAHAVASQALRDLYAATKYYLKRKFSQHPGAANALELAAEKPASPARKASSIITGLRETALEPANRCASRTAKPSKEAWSGCGTRWNVRRPDQALRNLSPQFRGA